MKLQTIAFTFASTLVLSSSVWAMDEIEVNHPLSGAQSLPADSSAVSINGVLGTVGGGSTEDLDYFTFYANEDDVLTIDIDGGAGGAQSVDTYIALFNPDGTINRANDDGDSVDAGSISSMDSRIDNFVVPSSGYYTVGVSNYPRIFQDGGDVVLAAYGENGDYVLNITGMVPVVQEAPQVVVVEEPQVVVQEEVVEEVPEPEALQIALVVKPGQNGGHFPPINPKARGKIPVALLTTNNFDAMSVDVSSLTFGATGDEDSLSHCNKRGKDVNRDGRLDLLCHFNNQAANFDKSSQEGTVRGLTDMGVLFEGHGFLKVVPAK